MIRLRLLIIKGLATEINLLCDQLLADYAVRLEDARGAGRYAVELSPLRPVNRRWRIKRLLGGMTMLTAEQRAELEALGPETVRAKLSQPGTGRGAGLAGFKTGSEGAGYLTRGDVEDWLVEKRIEEARIQKSTLRWARIAGWAGIVSAVAAIVGIGVTIWLAKHEEFYPID